MFITMKAPASRDKGQRTVRCNESQADILRKVGWTRVEGEAPIEAPLVTNVAAHYIAETMGSPPDPPKTTPDGKPIPYPPIIIEPEPVQDPDEVRPKRKYTRRDIASIKPKRRYRRRDMKAED